jgi:hypothetical protein
LSTYQAFQDPDARRFWRRLSGGLAREDDPDAHALWNGEAWLPDVCERAQRGWLVWFALNLPAAEREIALRTIARLVARSGAIEPYLAEARARCVDGAPIEPFRKALLRQVALATVECRLGRERVAELGLTPFGAKALVDAAEVAAAIVLKKPPGDQRLTQRLVEQRALQAGAALPRRSPKSKHSKR